MAGLKYSLHGFKQETGRHVISMDIGIKTNVGNITRTVVRHGANNNFWGFSTV